MPSPPHVASPAVLVVTSAGAPVDPPASEASEPSELSEPSEASEASAAELSASSAAGRASGEGEPHAVATANRVVAAAATRLRRRGRRVMVMAFPLSTVVGSKGAGEANVAERS